MLNKFQNKTYLLIIDFGQVYDGINREVMLKALRKLGVKLIEAIKLTFQYTENKIRLKGKN